MHWLSWHREIGAAQDAYLAHNRAWQAYLARAAEDPAEFDVEQTDVNTTFEAAEQPIRAALPDPALYDLDATGRPDLRPAAVRRRWADPVRLIPVPSAATDHAVAVQRGRPPGRGHGARAS